MATSKYNKKFEVQMSYFINKTNKAITEVKRLAIFELFSTIVDRTPLWIQGRPHTGTAKWNWMISIGNPRMRALKGTDPSGEKTKARGYEQLKKLSDLDEDVYIENSAPYIFLLEDGGYPVPAAPNSRTSGGFSKQAPQGMAKISALEWNIFIPMAVKQARK